MSISALIRLFIVVAVLLLIDIYAFQAFKTSFRNTPWVRYVYWLLSAFMYVALVVIMMGFRRGDGPTHLFSMVFAFVLLLVVPKLIIIIGLTAEDLGRVITGIVKKAGGNEGSFLPSRRKFISNTLLVLAAIPFTGILHGVFRGKYKYRVIRKKLFFDDLPAGFEGFTLTQISDVHSGSFDNRKEVERAIEMINKQGSDLMVFTGDLVNNKATEIEPWKEVFEKVSAPMGKFSILGNHDYGDYIEWPSRAEKIQNLKDLEQHHADMGYRLLKNESVKLQRNGSTINLVGVENWGAGGFAKHGDLDTASANVKGGEFNILLSHDPSHFDEKVKVHAKKMHLTLSGHTHGMQFGIEIPRVIKWSPVKYRYPKWAGLYEEAGKYLYVNRGFGFLGFPGRVGIWPEITVLEFRKTTI